MSQMNVSSELSPELNRKKFFEERITEVADSLRRDFEPEFKQDHSGFRSRVIGRLRAALPKKQPGRKPNPIIVAAFKMYRELEAQGKKGKDGIWHQLAAKVYPNYSTLPLDGQRLIRVSPSGQFL